MAKVVSTLTNVISYINSLYEVDSTPPTAGDEDFVTWTGIANVAINLWEMEKGTMWRELFVKLQDAPDGDKTTDGTNSYTCPTLFRFPASGYVWIGSGTNKTAYRVIDEKDLQLYENNNDKWCYFTADTSPTLEFNPNLTIGTGENINYNYYKYATAVSSGSDVFEMSDPMFVVYYVLSELKKEEGDTSAAAIATQKLDNMVTRNHMPAWLQNNSMQDMTDSGFGV